MCVYVSVWGCFFTESVNVHLFRLALKKKIKTDRTKLDGFEREKSKGGNVLKTCSKVIKTKRLNQLGQNMQYSLCGCVCLFLCVHALFPLMDICSGLHCKQ